VKELNPKVVTTSTLKARFISFEGGEGGGKTTQIKLLTHALNAAGIDTLQTREPGGSPGAESIRSLLVQGEPDRWDPLTETLLHFAARRDHLTQVILPALKKGQWVLTDRFADSTMAYQGYGHGVNKKAIHSLYQFVAGSRQPDMTIILDLPPKDGLSRSKEREEKKITQKEDRYERMGVDFHERLRDGFLDIARKNRKRCIVIDTTRGIDDIEQDIRRLVFEKFGIYENE
jgi:dTMP kinase